MRAAILLLLLIPSAAIAANMDPAAAVKAHMECVIENAAKLDDGRMKPDDLARLIQPLCHSKHETAMEAASPQKWMATPPARAHELEFNHTLAAVLLYRERVGRHSK